MDKEDCIQRARMFHYSTGMPVAILEGEKEAYSLPEPYITAAGLCGRPLLMPSGDAGQQGAQYIQSPSLERYVVLSIDEGFVLRAGPTLKEQVPQARVGQLIRNGVLPLHSKKELTEHYAACQVWDDDRYYYAGRLLEALFASSIKLKETGSAPAESAPIDKGYYSQTVDYRQRQFSHAPYAIEQEICRMIASGESIKSQHILREINAMPRAKLAGNPFRSLKNSLMCSCAFMTRAAITGGVAPDAAFTLSDAYIQQIEASASPAELDGFEAKMIEGFTASVNQVRNARYSLNVVQAMDYIEAHLSEPVTLQDIADAVYLNPRYISGLFKQETGENLHGYILRKRVEESRYFVRYGSESIAEIALFYQFCSQSHFIQAFRQYCGMTPGQYRKNCARK